MPHDLVPYRPTAADLRSLRLAGPPLHRDQRRGWGWRSPPSVSTEELPRAWDPREAARARNRAHDRPRQGAPRRTAAPRRASNAVAPVLLVPLPLREPNEMNAPPGTIGSLDIAYPRYAP